MRSGLAVTALLLALSGLPAQAPAGFRTYVDRDTGLTGFRPSNYTEIPVPPPEEVIRARFVAKAKPKVRKEGRARIAARKADISIFMFREGQTTPPDGAPNKAAAPESVKEQIIRKNAVSSWDEFKKKRLARLTLAADKKRKNCFTVQFKKRDVGYVGFVRKGPYLLGVLGKNGSSDPKRMGTIVRRMVGSLDLKRSNSRSSSHARKLDLIYKGKSYRAIEHRKKVRRALAKGWKALDTENYILVHHSRNEKLLNKIARDIEAMRAFYAGMFPPVRAVDAVSVVRVCKDRKEYLSYGGRASSGGYWNFVAEELVFFDYRETMKKTDHRYKGRRLSDRDSLLVLYHEAFHQYIFYAVGEVRPHDWFNEGLGDYYSGAIIPQYGKKVSRIGPSRWRIVLAKRQCKQKKGFIPLEQLLHADHRTYYDRRKVSLFYAAGWSFCFFLRESKEALKHPRWSKLLDDYFDHLKAGYKRETETRQGTVQEKQAAGALARKAAIKKALEGIDLVKLEAAWVSYISKLKNPWPSRRK